MRRLLSLSLLATCALTAMGCPSVQITEAVVHSPQDCVLVVHSKVSGLTPVADHCKVTAEFGEWRGVGTTPMVQRVQEPQDVFSEIRRWEKTYNPVAAGQMRVRFFYNNELMDQKYFPAPDFPKESLERQQYWAEGEGAEWPKPEKKQADVCPGCGAKYPSPDAKFCPQCGQARPGH